MFRMVQKIWTDLSSVLSQSTRLPDSRTDGRTDRILISRLSLACTDGYGAIGLLDRSISLSSLPWMIPRNPIKRTESVIIIPQIPRSPAL